MALKDYKSTAANGCAVVFIILGFFSPWFAWQFLNMGLFALSGGLTNWLAIYMLFEKVPLLAGSGVIPNRFEQFKVSIRELIMQQFFNEANLRHWLEQEEKHIGEWFKPDQLIDNLDYDHLYKRLVDTLMDTYVGTVLGAIGGARLFDAIKVPIIGKLKRYLAEMVRRPRFKNAMLQCIDNDALVSDMQARIGKVIDQRLDELTPQVIKAIVKRMMHEHLGWLVVWGVVFGAILGLIASFITPVVS